MSKNKFEEPDIEKIIADFISEANQLEENDLNFCKQTLEPFKERYKNSGFEIDDDLACFCYVEFIALGFVYKKHGIKHQSSSPEFLSKNKPYLDFVAEKEHIDSILKLNPLEFIGCSRIFYYLFTKMFKKLSWVERNDTNKSIYYYIKGNSILFSIIRIYGFIEDTGIKPQDYFKLSLEPLIVSNFLYSSLLSEASNVPEFKNYHSKVAKDSLIKIKELCDYKTKNLFYPEDRAFERKFVEDTEEQKSEAEGIFNELIIENFFNKKSLVGAVKYSLVPGEKLLSFSAKFKDKFLNEIESYYINQGHTTKEIREARDKHENILEYSPDEQEQIEREYSKIFREKNTEVQLSSEDVEHAIKAPQIIIEILRREEKLKEVLIEFTNRQSPKIKEVGKFILKKGYTNYIRETTGKLENIEIEKDSNLNERTIKRFTNGFYNYVKEKHPDLNPS